MSSSKYDKIGNYNLSYELLKDAVKEFDGYVLGLSQNDIWLFANHVGIMNLLKRFFTNSNNAVAFFEE